MPKIVIRHLSGTKANQVEEVPLQGFHEVLIGRESNSQIRFDADRDDLVSRNHARITRDPVDPTGFLITDLESRNGTFINRQRIYGATHLQHGDRVQLGPSGPEFTFEIDPPPAMRPTRLADSMPPPPTREATVGMPGTAVPPGMADPRYSPDAPRPVGRATVERLVGAVSSQMKGESRRTMWTAVIGILVVLVAVAGYFAWNRQQQIIQARAAEQQRSQLQADFDRQKDAERVALERLDKLAQLIASNRSNKSPESQKLNEQLEAELQQAKIDLANSKAGQQADADKIAKLPRLTTEPNRPPQQPPIVIPAEQIHAENARSVILIEAAWKVTDAGTGGQIYLYHHPNDLGACPDAAKSEYLPMFVDDGGALTPVLSTLPNGGNNTPIVGTESGSGFIVGGAGFFLTNRHVLAPWRATWNVGSFTKKTMGLKVKNNSIVGCIPASDFPADWVPAEGSKMVVDKMESAVSPQTGMVTTSTYSDRLKYNPLKTSVQGEAVFNVTFAKTTQRYLATSVALSEKHDVALGKVDLPGGGQGVTLSPESEDAVKPGQTVVVMGYPAISPEAFGVEVSRDMFTNRAHLSAIADPSLSEGPISKVLPSGNAVRGVDGYISSGEVYQLGINTTGAGNSGGPVFDDKGRVIGIFYAGRSYGGATVTYAVPVKFGKELIDNPPVMR